MSTFLRGIAAIATLLLTMSMGAVIGIFVAFWSIYIFVDENRAGESSVGTNLSFLMAASAFGFLGLILGSFAGSRLLRWGGSSQTRTAGLSPDGHLFGEVDR